MAVHNRLQEALRLRGMKQTELAEKSGIERGTINNWVKQKYQPKYSAILELAKILDVSADWLAGYSESNSLKGNASNVDLHLISESVAKDKRLLSLLNQLETLTEEQIECVEQIVNLFNK